MSTREYPQLAAAAAGGGGRPKQGEGLVAEDLVLIKLKKPAPEGYAVAKIAGVTTAQSAQAAAARAATPLPDAMVQRLRLDGAQAAQYAREYPEVEVRAFGDMVDDPDEYSSGKARRLALRLHASSAALAREAAEMATRRGRLIGE